MIIGQKALLIGAPHSGSGKTVVTLALLQALKLRGVDISGAKAGPDYIDPVFHGLACGKPSVNLDPWAMSIERCRQLAAFQDSSHLLVESMMGLFDGAANGQGSGAQLARGLNAPVLLVVDAAKQSHSIAALVRGFRDHDRDLNICGVILNKVGSARHEAMLRQALAQIGVRVAGVILRDKQLQLPERHLGLVQAGEMAGVEDFIHEAAQIVTTACDLDFITECFASIEGDNENSRFAKHRIAPLGQHTAVAQDRVFSFIYPHLLQDWRARGVEVSVFSPLANEGPDERADGVFLPGGYPELHGGKIAGADKFIKGMDVAQRRGAMIYGECGGYMVLGKGLVDSDGIRHKMLGMLDLETSFEKRKLHLGYRRARAQGEFFAGKHVNMHEFHYSTVVREEGKPLFSACDALGEGSKYHGLRNGKVMGSYLHLIDKGEV